MQVTIKEPETLSGAVLPGRPLLEPQSLLTEPEMASHLRICRRQLHTWRKKGIIPYLKIGRTVRFRLSDVEAALEKRTIHHKTPNNPDQ